MSLSTTKLALLGDSKLSFTRYGVELLRLQSDQLERVRKWRNQPHIREKMIDKSEISSAHQQQWFEKLCGDLSQVYFVAHFKQQPIGVASLKAIDCENGICEPGMYIGEEAFSGHIVPFCIAFALNDFAFEMLDMQRLDGQIYPDNQASMRFHLACGYREVESTSELVKLHLNHGAYVTAREKIARFIRY